MNNPILNEEFKVHIVSLGCDKNLCDSETMIGLLKERGYIITSDEHEADAVVINSCCFIKDALEESINTVFEFSLLKKEKLKYIIVTGCMSERFKEEIIGDMPEIDACLGTTSFDKVCDTLDRLRADSDAGESERIFDQYESIERLVLTETKRENLSGTYIGYLKIAEGCNKFCSYCIIPRIRGHFRSVPMDNLIRQAKELAADGITELILVAQETTCYGIDLYGKKSLAELINKLSEIPELETIRVLYCYPEEIDDELIDCFANNPKLAHYIDMPIQHSEDSILKRMGRKTNRESIIEVISKLREKVPDIALRTSLISGFPGETEEDHSGLMEFVDTIEFDRLGVFTYSREEGTPAADFPDQVDSELAERWREEIMELQQAISLEKNEALIGETVEVVIDGYDPETERYIGRTYKDAPDIDGLVFVNCDYEIISGTKVSVRILEAGPYDMIGDIE